jgi:CRP-like cAMP-binding protein
MPQDLAASLLGLRRIALLEGLPDDALAAVAASSAWRSHARGRLVLTRGATDRSLQFVVAGRVRVTLYASDGRQLILRDLGAGEFFGELAAIDGEPRSADAIAIEPSLIAALPHEPFHALCRCHPIVAERLQQRLAADIRELTTRLVGLASAGVARRVAAELVRLAHEVGAPTIAPLPTHADLAAWIGTYREQVTRELSALERAGVLSRARRAIRILDVAALERAAHGHAPASGHDVAEQASKPVRARTSPIGPRA